jgi:hypothetical protein
LRFVVNGLVISLHESRRGGIGRRAGLKIQFTQVSVGSIPSVGTPLFFSGALHRKQPPKNSKARLAATSRQWHLLRQ